MIKATELTLQYGDFTAVEGVSFDISSGEVVGLLGHNGAGKTTILRMLTGFLEPSAGRIEIDGFNVTDHRSEVQKKIGYLPENCPLYPEMTVIDALEYAAELRGVPEGQRLEVMREAIAQTKLTQRASHPIHTLSRGYRQRVGVAQAILQRPEVLLLDEPTNGLDPSQIQHMRALITGLGKSSTVILSTHILQEVQAVCDRVIIILNGRLALDSRLEDLQNSRRLLLCVDCVPDESGLKLSGLKGVRAVEFLHSQGVQHHYALELKHNPSGDGLRELTPEIARALVERGTKLFAIHPETRDLETVFREISTNARGAADGA